MNSIVLLIDNEHNNRNKVMKFYDETLHDEIYIETGNVLVLFKELHI